ncbi:DNA-directed RNA polymerase II Rpb10 [Organic Lake phycodnavirus 1]|jgi:DNA-directed RNA polymerase I, II, and III subunit RPABC5|nr:DNA-directed RNA polymerase II Rpb10 [Organic Lake phycodnavirus 1]
MIIPVKCFTCGKVIANKYQKYLDKVGELKKDKSQEINYLDTSNIEKTPEGKVLDELDLVDICCRRHMLTHVDIL